VKQFLGHPVGCIRQPGAGCIANLLGCAAVKFADRRPAERSYFGVKVEGSYGPALLVQSDYVPPGYVLVAATYGPNAPRNVCAFRQHPNPAYQDLRLIPETG
jgi:hypothetical protein